MVRIPAMRRSIFATRVDDAAMLVAANRAVAQRDASTRRTALRRSAALSETDLDLLATEILGALTEAMSVAQLTQLIGASTKLLPIVQLLAYEGRVLRIAGGATRSDGLRYVATSAWLGGPIDTGLDSDDALEALARRYLDAYGPARVADFAWWSGSSQTRAAAAFARISTVDVGQGMLLPEGQHADFIGVEPLAATEVAAIPKWDCLTMGYAPNGRARLVDPEFDADVYDRGDGRAVLLRAGRAVATWSHRFTSDRMVVRHTALGGHRLTAAEVERALMPAAAALDASDLEIVGG